MTANDAFSAFCGATVIAGALGVPLWRSVLIGALSASYMVLWHMREKFKREHP